MNTILVTGATGFIGSHLCRRLIAEGNQVWGVSRRPQRPEKDNPVRWWQADLSEYTSVRELVRRVRPEIVFHLASRVSGSRELSEVAPMFQNNLASTVNVLLSASESGCERIIVAGSSEEPTQPDICPCSPYAAAKLSSTYYSMMFSELYKVRVIVPRIFMVYGPGQKDLTKLVPYTVCSMLQGERPRLSSGKRLIDWIYVDDVIEGLVRVETASNVDKVTFDLGSGSLVSVRAVVETIEDIVGNGTVPEFGALPDRVMEPERIADISQTERILSWKPVTSLRTGLDKTVQWYKATKNSIVYACILWVIRDSLLDLTDALQCLSSVWG